MTKHDNNLMGDSPNKSLFQQLQELLLKEEREYTLNLRRRLDSLESDQQTGALKQKEELKAYKKESAEIRAQLKALITKVKEQSERDLTLLKSKTKQEIVSLKEVTEKGISSLQEKTDKELTDIKEEGKRDLASLKEETAKDFNSLQVKTDQELNNLKEETKRDLTSLKENTAKDFSSLQIKTDQELIDIKEESKRDLALLKEETAKDFNSIQAKTDQELSDVKEETKHDLASLKEETAKDFNSFQVKTEQELSGLKNETKQDLTSLKEDTEKGITILKEETKQDFSALKEQTNKNIISLKEETEKGISALKVETKQDLSALKEDSEKLESNISNFKEDYNDFHKHVTGFESGVEDFKQEINEFKEEVTEFKEEINHFKVGIEDPDQFKNKVQPVIEEKIGYIKSNFNDVFGQEINHSIKLQITDSKEDFIETIYPLMGKLVKSYVKNEFEKLFESINSRLDKTFSYRSFINRIKSYFTGIRYEELAIKNALGSNIEDVYIIHRESGLLIGNYSRNNAADVDMVAGMLAAIKQFAEDTFTTTAGDDLETIEYGSNIVMIQSFYKYYVATVVSGVIDSRFKSKLNNHLLSFGEKNLSKPISQIDSDLYDNISKKLKLSFYEFEEVN